MSSLKLDRNYELRHFDSDGNITVIKPPITIEFDIERKKFGTSNVGSIRVYNLSKNNRQRIRKDEVDYDLNEYVILKAGYGNNLSVILNMTISQAWSVRQGVDVITEIQCLDGAFGCIQAQLNLAFSKNEDQRKVLSKMLDVFLEFGMAKGAIGDIPGLQTGAKGDTYNGKAIDVVKEVTGGAVFVDNNTLHVLRDNEYIDGEVLLVNESTGLIGTPTLEKYWVNFDMIFEPLIGPGRLIRLESTTGPQGTNGLYIVHSLHHRGMISPTVAGAVITSVGCYPPGDFPVAVSIG